MKIGEHKTKLLHSLSWYTQFMCENKYKSAHLCHFGLYLQSISMYTNTYMYMGIQNRRGIATYDTYMKEYFKVWGDCDVCFPDTELPGDVVRVNSIGILLSTRYRKCREVVDLNGAHTRL